ncbi:MAG: LysR family transcriptional regulator [Lachnospiraceae bacterium]|nr:LysR family transcriptional regulator [Lachnospiraceae bacterium]
MNLKSLEYFVEVARDLNMTTAAQRLYISQQALSSQIQKLEEYYGVTLFERRPKLQLTYAGKRLLEGAETVLRDSIDLTNSLSEISKNRSGILRLGIPTYRAAESLPLILPAYTKKWPNVTITLEDTNTTEMLEKLLAGALDACVVSPSPSEVQGLGDRLEFVRLLDDRTYVICSDEMLSRYFGSRSEAVRKRSRQGIDLQEFRDVPFLLHKPPMRLRQVEDECFNNAGFRPNVFLEAGNTELMLALYPCHVGCFFCREARIHSIARIFGDHNAFPVNYDEGPHRQIVYFVRRKTAQPRAHVLDFERLMQKAWKEIALH